MKPQHNLVILIAPPSYHFNEDRFFSLDGSLNRDGTLVANHQMRETLRKAGYPVHTADQYETISQKFPNVQFHFWSFGASSKTALAFKGRNVRKIGAGLFEPPLVKPDDYRKISQLAEAFERVYLHNVSQDGYRLTSQLNSAKLRRLNWTNRPFKHPLEDESQRNRQNRVAMIVGAHFRKARSNNGYGLRLQAMEECGLDGPLDIFGNGWGRLQLRSPLASAYWALNLRFSGIEVTSPKKKHDVYSRYEFALCFENMAMLGYITEKIFDALFSGCIPIYWGAPDITDYIPSDCFVDRRQFSSSAKAIDYCLALTKSQRAGYRFAIEKFLSSNSFQRFSRGFHGEVEDFYLGEPADAG